MYAINIYFDNDSCNNNDKMMMMITIMIIMKIIMIIVVMIIMMIMIIIIRLRLMKRFLLISEALNLLRCFLRSIHFQTLYISSRKHYHNTKLLPIHSFGMLLVYDLRIRNSTQMKDLTFRCQNHKNMNLWALTTTY